MILFSLLLALCQQPQPVDAVVTPTTNRILFLGDSNTFAGTFIAYLDTYFYRQQQKIELINLGLPSETCTGLSEQDHPYPRPNVHTRLAAALTKTKPDMVVVCYGMNDGIYSPFDESRFKQYQEGIQKVIDACEQAKAKVILMTPAPFEPKPLKGKLQPAGMSKYSWVKPYEKYDDDVLTKYSEWLCTTYRKRGYLVIDAHTALLKHLADVRQTKPDYVVSGDGIHPDANGHAVIYREILKTLGVPEDKIQVPTGEFSRLAQERQRLLGLAWLTDVGHKRPDTPKGIPLAEAKEKATKLEEELRRLATK